MRWNLGPEYKHGQEFNDKIVWVGPDGIARPVKPELFNQLEEMVQKSRDFAKSQSNAIRTNDHQGVKRKVATFVEGVRSIVQDMTLEEIIDELQNRR